MYLNVFECENNRFVSSFSGICTLTSLSSWLSLIHRAIFVSIILSLLLSFQPSWLLVSIYLCLFFFSQNFFFSGRIGQLISNVFCCILPVFPWLGMFLHGLVLYPFFVLRSSTENHTVFPNCLMKLVLPLCAMALPRVQH